MNWVEEEPKEQVQVSFVHYGAGFVGHNLLCPSCNKNPAMWWGNPVWVFALCDECREPQRLITFDEAVKAANRSRRKKRWWQR